MVFNERRIVPASFCGSRHADGPQAAAGNGGDGGKAGVRTLAEARARDERPHAILSLQDERVAAVKLADVPVGENPTGGGAQVPL
jgi:hypothetical protein